MSVDVSGLTQSPVLPAEPRPIVSIGAGGIVKDAHLPAYALAGFAVESLFDLDSGRARALAEAFGIGRVAGSLEELVSGAPAGAVFDVALPASQVYRTLERLPDGSAVLIQKPMGEHLEDARAICGLCRRKGLIASVNFQLRYAPYVMAARDLIARGVIGEVHDVDVRVMVYTPWHLWSFLEGLPRVEILYHSVHYIDLIRSFLGDPARVFACTVKHPKTLKLASTRSSIILDYGQAVRANISTNHGHSFGLKHQESYIKWEGTGGAIKARLGLLMNYPQGLPDALEFCREDEAWESVPLRGSWYPHAFIGPMSDLMRCVNGEIGVLPTGVEDALRTMAVVEAAYRSDESGGVRPELEGL